MSTFPIPKAPDVMVEKKQRSKRLSQIMHNNKHFDRAVESYIDQLRKKRDWKNLEQKMIDCKDAGWPKDKLKKIFQWERQACELHSRSMDKAMESIKHMADEISDVQLKDLKEWIRKSSHSKEAWNRNTVSIDDSLPLIKAKIMHLAYMSRSPTPAHIGNIIKNKE